MEKISESTSDSLVFARYVNAVFYALGPLAILHVFFGRPDVVSAGGATAGHPVMIADVAVWGAAALPLGIVGIVLLRKWYPRWSVLPRVSPSRGVAAVLAWCLAAIAMNAFAPAGSELGAAFIIQFAAVSALVSEKRSDETLSLHALTSAASREPGRQLVSGAVSAAATLPALSLLFFAGRTAYPAGFDGLAFPPGPAPGGVQLVLSVLLIPLLEEILFRAGVIGLLRPRTGVFLAILLSSTLFAALHFQPEIFWARFVAGLFMGWLYVRSGSVLPSLTLHAIMNASIIGLPILLGR